MFFFHVAPVRLAWTEPRVHFTAQRAVSNNLEYNFHIFILSCRTLVVEVIGQMFPNGTCELSVAHYGVQNGDAMRDPEVTMLVVPNEEGQWQWKPLTFLNDYVGVYQVAAEYDHFGTVRVRNTRLVHDLARFTEEWDRNIKQQGFIEAFRRKQACTLNGAEIGETSALR